LRIKVGWGDRAELMGERRAVNYRLVAIDLDGTVVDRAGFIVPGAAGAVRQLLSRGITVTLATGRMYQPSTRFARELGITAPLICYQGALIRDPSSGETLWHKPLSVPLARRVVAEIRHLGMHQYAYVDGEIYVEEFTERDLVYAQNNGVQLRLVEDLLAVAERQPTEIAARGSPDEIERLLAHLRSRCAGEIIVNKIHTSFCEVANSDSGKGNALSFLASRLGIRREETVAIGDSPNDISMLQWAGIGIVVGHAPPEVRVAADWTIDSATSSNGFCEAVARLLTVLERD